MFTPLESTRVIVGVGSLSLLRIRYERTLTLLHLMIYVCF